jgi:hypothetical protein
VILINPDRVSPPAAWIEKARVLTKELCLKSSAERAEFIKAKRSDTWAAPALVQALRDVVGNKCWYTEVPLEGADPNVDHFRPKGAVREVDSELKPTEATSPGYWWLAFDYRNYRLSSMHANQRRVDEHTEGGKWDFFPVRGFRPPEQTDWAAIIEDHLVLDPCSSSDVALLWFDPNGAPCFSQWRTGAGTPEDQERVRVTIWLYHLDKTEVSTKRSAHLDDIRKDLLKADASYTLWKSPGGAGLVARDHFNRKVAEIKMKLADDSPFAGAKRCAVRTAIADYPWIDEFQII